MKHKTSSKATAASTYCSTGPSLPVSQLVPFPGFKVIWELGGDLSIRHTITNACMDLIQGFPPQLGVWQVVGGHDGAAQRAGPD